MLLYMNIQYLKKSWSFQSKEWLLYALLSTSVMLVSCQEKKQQLACGPKPCPSYFINFVEATDIVVEAQETYVKKRKQFRLDHTYNQPALDEFVKREKKLNICLEETPLGNEGVARKFFGKMNNSRLREVHETDRYFQDKLSEHYLAVSKCFEKANKELDELITEYP